MALTDWVGPVTGIIGTGLGIYNILVARRKEKRERQEKAQAQVEEATDWELYAKLVEASKEGLIFDPEPGSDDHKRAERLAGKGMLERLPNSMGYAIPGQRFRLGL